MKQIPLYRHLLASCTLIALLLLASCTDKTPDYARLIEKDVPLVVRIDVKQIGEKSGMADRKETIEKAQKRMSEAGLSAEAMTKMKAIADDPAEAGVDLRKPLLFFAEQPDAPSAALVGALHDSGKFTELLQTISKEAGAGDALKTEGELKTFQHQDLLIVFNDDWFYLTNQDRDESAKAEAVKKRFEADDEHSIRSREDFKEMCRAEGFMQMLLNGSALEQLGTKSKEIRDMLALMPANTKASDFAVCFDLSSKKGELTLTAQSIAMTDEAKKALEQNYESLGKVDGKLLAYVPEDALLTAATHIDGSKIYSQLEASLSKEGDITAEQKELIKNMLSSLKGDVVVSFNSMDMRNGPKAQLLADATSMDGLNQIVKQNKNMFGVVEMAPGQYSVNGLYFFGVYNNVFYLSSIAPLAEMKKAEKPIDAGDFKGKYGYMLLNLKAIAALPVFAGTDAAGSSPEAFAFQLLKNCDKLDFSMSELNKGELRLLMADKSADPIEYFTRQAEKAANL